MNTDLFILGIILHILCKEQTEYPPTFYIFMSKKHDPPKKQPYSYKKSEISYTILTVKYNV